MRKTMTQSNTEQLRFPAINGLTVRADFNGGVLSTDFGPLILDGVDRQIQVAHQMTKAFNDQRHPSYIDHRLADMMAQRVYHIAFGYEEANDTKALRKGPLFKMGVGRTPLQSRSGSGQCRHLFPPGECRNITKPLSSCSGFYGSVHRLLLKVRIAEVDE